MTDKELEEVGDKIIRVIKTIYDSEYKRVANYSQMQERYVTFGTNTYKH